MPATTAAEHEIERPAFLPAPSLPKGGGALRGISETFSVNATHGSASLAVPLALSPGRGGAEPPVGLAYDSGSGNSPFGLGFHLGLPSIARRTRLGLPTYTDADVFVLTGAEDLVPELVEQGDGSWRAQPYPATVDGVACQVQRYRPRVEDFSRIERCRPVAGGPDFWRVTSPGNVTSLFGRTDLGRVSRPGAPDDVFEWLLESTSDDRGEVTAYGYKAEDLAGVDPATVAERHRLDGPAPAGRYLKTVRYANTTPGSAAGSCFLVVLDYGEHDLTPTEVRPWPVRPDPFSTYRPTFEVRTWRLCQRVLMFHDLPAEFAGGPNPRLVAATEFGYAASPVVTTLATVRHRGYDYVNGAYVQAALPPLAFGWTTAAPDATVRDVVAEPVTDASGVWWVDLDGDGAPGVLHQTPGAWWYQRNTGGGTLAPPDRVDPVPATSERPYLSDVDGSGRLALVHAGGFASRTDHGWAPLQPFPATAPVDLADPHLRRLDLDGDGLADLLVGCADGVRWTPSRGRDGYGPSRWVPGEPGDDEHGPRLAYADEARAIFVADMSGDGLADLVRIRNGEVCYWPNLGYGRFGPKVTMAGAPWFDHPERFDPGRIRLGDLDGTGPTDLVYLGPDVVRGWVNQSGNSFAPPTSIGPFPAVDSLSHVDVVDLLGTGTACLVWTSPRPAAATRYLDLSHGTQTGLDPADPRLAGWKPYLLHTITRNTGATTTIEYAPSTRWSFADRRAGRPWRTRLPFPVHTVAAMTVADSVTGDVLRTDYTYRHGYFDGTEREFRGFGLVESRDSESVPIQSTVDLPPVRHRTWYHLGAVEDTLTDTYTGDPAAVALPPDTIDPALDPAGWRQAWRLLAGRVRRTEVYADDGVSTDPYSVEVFSYQVRQEQPAAGNPYPVLAGFGLQSASYHYERVPADPRIARSVTLAVDAYGTVTSQLEIGLPRRAGGLPEQQTPLLRWTRHDVVHTDTATTLRLAVPVAGQVYQVTDPAVTDLRTATPAELAGALATLAEVPYEQDPVPGTPTRRLIGATRDEYWADDLSAPLPAGQVGARALPYRDYRRAFTAGLVTEVYGSTVDASVLAGAGYVAIDGDWWAPSGIRGYDPAGFYTPLWTTDPFGNTARVGYDAYHLFVTSTRASDRPEFAALVSTSVPDYRVLAIRQTTDPNGNGAKVAFDPLGMVVATWSLSHVAGEGDPDPLPGSVFSYDLTAVPMWAQGETRERHGDPSSAWQRSRTYSDGFGRVAMTKAQAEPGLAWTPDGSGGLVLADTGSANRWVGSGRTVYNNKGLPVEQYEPYFSANADYETADALVKHDVPTVVRYDPLGRAIRTDRPDGAYTKVEFTPWHHLTYDANDTVADSAWYAERQSSGTPPEQVRAAALALAHAGTPSRSDADTLGRVTRSTMDNGSLGSYTTLVELDLGGNRRTVTDARGVVVQRHRYDLLGQTLRSDDVDAGVQLTLPDCTGAPLRSWTARGHEIIRDYDPLRRGTAVWVREPTATTYQLAELSVYGEAHPNAVALNLLGQAYRHYDQAGLTEASAYDFEGHLLSSTRTLARAATGADWTALAGVAFAQLDAAGAGELDASAAFTTASTFDALGRMVTQTRPDGSVVSGTYNAAGLTETLTVQAGPLTTTVVTGVDYDARRRRVTVDYGNTVAARYDYDDRSHRLVGLRATAGTATLQAQQYVYDPVGNVVEAIDGAQQSVFFAGTVAPPLTRYVYEPAYRLASATGREHASLGAPADTTEPAYAPLPHPNDPNAIRPYTQTYSYDEVGNLTRMQHMTTAPGSWTRTYAYVSGTNRLDRHTGTGGAWLPPCTYDAAGNATSMPYLPTVTWDHANRLGALDLGGGGQVSTVYDAAAMRVRRVWTHGALVDEYVYLGGYERYRRYRNGILVVERHTTHVMDGPVPVAAVETLTVDTDDPQPDLSPRLRYQFTNQLGSVVLECDAAGQVISYEEYHPFGTTALWLARDLATTSPRRYRYCAKEKDAECGLYYFGARYYAPWLGRWFSPDPAGGANPYWYCSDDPVGRHDPDGQEDRPREVFGTAKVMTGQESQDEVRQMYAQVGVTYTGDARWVPQATGGGTWRLHDEQILANSSNTTDYMRAAHIQAAPPVAKPKPPAPKPTGPTGRQIIAAKRQQEWESAKRGMWDAGVDMTVGLIPNLLGLMDPLKAGALKTGDTKRDEELQASHDDGNLLAQTVVAAGSLVPWAEMAEAGQLAMSKMPSVSFQSIVESNSLTSVGRMPKITSASTRWASHTPPKTYKVYFEAKLQPTPPKHVWGARADDGWVRMIHKLTANEQLDAAFEDAATAARLKKAGVARPPTSRGGIVSPSTPRGFIWHHDALRPGVMQLVRAADHTPSSLVWDLMHPGGRGGFAAWGRAFF
jgi:RHS repeat-associated protein